MSGSLPYDLTFWMKAIKRLWFCNMYRSHLKPTMDQQLRYIYTEYCKITVPTIVWHRRVKAIHFLRTWPSSLVSSFHLVHLSSFSPWARKIHLVLRACEICVIQTKKWDSHLAVPKKLDRPLIELHLEIEVHGLAFQLEAWYSGQLESTVTFKHWKAST